MNRFVTHLRGFYHRFVSLRGTPKAIAVGFAAGVMIGTFPIFGIHIFMALAITFLFRVHFSSMLIGSWVSGNPLTFPPLVVGHFYVGNWLIGPAKAITTPETGWTLSAVWDVGLNLIAPTLLGFLINGSLLALITFPLVLWWVARLRQRQEVP